MNIITAMKPILKIALTFVLMGSLGICSAESQESNNTVQDPAVQDAINLLKTSKAMVDPSKYFGPVKTGTQEKLYLSQMNAIKILGNAKIPGTALLLLPYLNYPAEQYYAELFYEFGPPGEDVHKTYRIWPVLLALTEIPESASVLSVYALDRNNSLDARFAAFNALRYVDLHHCKIVGEALKEEFNNSKHRMAFITGIAQGKLPYYGYYPVPQ